jgi:hypothetical protein
VLHFARDDLGYTHSLRLTFAYDERDVRLVRVERIAMRSIAPATPPPQEGDVGHWVELRDANGELLYHRPLHDPMRESIEVVGDTPDDPLYRVPNPVRTGEFQVRVPDLPGAHELLLYGMPRKGKKRDEAKSLIREEFAQLRRRDISRPAGSEESGGGSS